MAHLRVLEYIMAMGDGLWLFKIKDAKDSEHSVICPNKLVLEDQDDDWIPVAVCGTDEVAKIALVEFPDGCAGCVNRLWVPLTDVKFGTSHAHLFPGDVDFPVISVDMKSDLTSWEDRITVVKIESSAETAQLLCDRLNRVKGQGRIFFWQPARKNG